MKKVAIVTGITGQDGSFLSDLLLEKGFDVYGLKRRSSSHSLGCSAHLENDIEVVEGDLLDLPSLENLCKKVRPHMFFNLAAQSHVRTSFDQPANTLQINALGVLHCLEAIKQSGIFTKFYQASTSEMFGGVLHSGDNILNEDSLFHPRSPYGCAKLYAHWITVNYRESYNMFNCCGILFNHESPRRGPNFVTRKISLAIAKIKLGLQEKLFLGNLDAKRDWGHAQDYVKGMYQMLNHNDPDDYVLSTGEAHSVREFCKLAFDHAGLGSYEDYVEINPAFYRPAEVHVLLGDSSKANKTFGWEHTMSFEDLVKDMVDSDMKLVSKGKEE